MILLDSYPAVTNMFQVDIRLRVKGGGFTGQIYALRQAMLSHGVASFISL